MGGLGIVLILGSLLWWGAARWEWQVPIQGQKVLIRWRERLSQKSHTLKYDWSVGSGECELEKHFGHLQQALPQLQKKFKRPLIIEVIIHPRLALGQQAIYVACLQRRFPEIGIYASPLQGEYIDPKC